LGGGNYFAGKSILREGRLAEGAAHLEAGGDGPEKSRESTKIHEKRTASLGKRPPSGPERVTS